jgi:hypothetical protein
MNDVTVGDDALAASTAFIINDPANAGRPVYVTYAIDHLNPAWRTVPTGYAYVLAREGEPLPSMPDAGTIEFPEDVVEVESAFRGFVALASYRYAAFFQERYGKEAALPHLLRAIDYDEKEQSETYVAYVARRAAVMERASAKPE